MLHSTRFCPVVGTRPQSTGHLKQCVVVCGAMLFYLVNPMVSGLCQELPSEPKLRIEGPEGQSVYAFVRYFDNSACTKTVTKRLTIEADGLLEPLEFGHEGFRVLLISPTREAIWISLLDGQATLKDAKSNSIGEIKLELGQVPEDDGFNPPRVLPNEEERELVRKILRAIGEADTQAFVADSPSASIQWQTLNAFCQTINRQLGVYQEADSELDGWLSWSGNLNTRVLSGPCSFAKGTCRFTLVIFDDLLWEVEADCDQIPDDWFNGPADEALYVEQAAELSTGLFDPQVEDQLQEIRSLFAPRFRESVTLEDLRGLSANLQKRFGAGPQEVIHVASQLERAKAAESETEATWDFRVFHLLRWSEGKECITQVDFVFNSGADNIGRGDLASIQVRDSWPSNDPNSAETAAELIRNISNSRPIVGLFHPQVRSLLDGEALQTSCDWLRDELGPLREAPELSTWETRQVGSYLIAQGNADFQNGTARIQLDYSDRQLIAATISTRTLAWQSAPYLMQQQEVADLAVQFWTRLLKGDAEQAHSLLAPRFQEKLPLREFKELIQASDFVGSSEFEKITTDVAMLSTRLDRPLPVLVAVYQIVQMEDGVRQPLRTEFQRTDAGWELLNFNTDFQATFVSNKPHRQFELLQSSLLQKDRSGFISLLDEKLASGVMPAILDGFLTKAASILDPSQRSGQFSCLHEYQLGTRYERFASELKSKEGQPVRLEATFELQRLVAFVVRSPELRSIVKQIDDLSCFDDLAMTVVEQWMAGDFSEAKENFVPELRDGKLEERLRRLKSTLLITHGSYRESWLTGRTLLPELNAVECWVAVEFEQAVVPLKVTFEVDAFRCRVSGFEPELR